MTPRQAGRSSLTLPLILAALCLILAAATWFALRRDAPDARELVPAPPATETDSAPPQVVESALEEPAERTLPSLLRLHGVVLEHDGTPCRRARALHVSLQLQGAWTTAKFAVDDEGEWTSVGELPSHAFVAEIESSEGRLVPRTSWFTVPGNGRIEIVVGSDSSQSLSILTAPTRAHLGGVSILAADPRELMRGGVVGLHPGSWGETPHGEHASPMDALELSASTYWIGSPGHAWETLAVVDGKPTRTIVALQRSGALRVTADTEWKDELAEDRALVLRPDPFPTTWPRRMAAYSVSLTPDVDLDVGAVLDGVLPGTYEVAIRDRNGPDLFDSATGPITVAVGRTSTVHLRRLPVATGVTESLHGTVLLEEFGADEQAIRSVAAWPIVTERDQVLPGQVRLRMGHELTEVRPGEYEWTQERVPSGEFLYTVHGQGWSFARTVRLDPVHAGTLLLTVPRRVEKELRFTAQGGASMTPRSVSVLSTANPDETLVQRVTHVLGAAIDDPVGRTLTLPDAPFYVAAPLSPGPGFSPSAVLVEGSSRTKLIDVPMGDPTRLRLVLRSNGLPLRLPMEWWSRLQLTKPDGGNARAGTEPIGLQDQAGYAECFIDASHSGSLTLDVPPIFGRRVPGFPKVIETGSNSSVIEIDATLVQLPE